jgi:hypothetical protein
MPRYLSAAKSRTYVAQSISFVVLPPATREPRGAVLLKCRPT